MTRREGAPVQVTWIPFYAVEVFLSRNVLLIQLLNIGALREKFISQKAFAVHVHG
jgi:hypothetical protein